MVLQTMVRGNMPFHLVLKIYKTLFAVFVERGWRTVNRENAIELKISRPLIGQSLQILNSHWLLTDTIQSNLVGGPQLLIFHSLC